MTDETISLASTPVPSLHPRKRGRKRKDPEKIYSDYLELDAKHKRNSTIEEMIKSTVNEHITVEEDIIN